MTFWLLGKSARNVFANHEPGDADIATEELVIDSDDSDVVTLKAVDQRFDDSSP